MNIYRLFHYLASSPLKWDDIKLKTACDLGFPVSDVAHIQSLENHLEVELNVLGLLGVDSPLPLYMIVAGMKEGDNAWRSLLNLINDYMYKLLFQCWLQLHPLAQTNQSRSRYSDYLTFLAASTNKEAFIPGYLVRRFFGKRRSLNDLGFLIADYLQDVSVYVRELEPVWFNVPQNQYHYLSQTAVLGDKILTTATNVFCQLYFDDWRRFINFLYGPNGEAQKLDEILCHFLPVQLQLNLQVTVALQQAKPCCVGDPQVGLGYFNLIGQNHKTEVTFDLH